MIPEHNQGDLVYGEHLVRYLFAAQFVRGKTVLDVACGSGYGTALLARHQAESVAGLDNSREAVEYAQQHYALPNVSFTLGNAEQLPFPDASFDVVVSFETIEHVREYEVFLQELKRVLKPTGLLILSTPNKDVYPAGNPFHIKEFRIPELEQLLGNYFSNVRLEYQDHVLSHVLYQPGTKLDTTLIQGGENELSEPLYVIALCSQADIGEYRRLGYADAAKEIVSREVVEERERHIALLQVEIQTHRQRIQDLEGMVTEREHHITILQQDLAGDRKHVEQLQQKQDAAEDLSRQLAERKKETERLEAEVKTYQKDIRSHKTKNKALKKKLQQAQTTLHLREQDLQEKMDQLEMRLNEKEEYIRNLYHSYSWRVTAPLRWVAMPFLKLFAGLKKVAEDAALGLSLWKREGPRQFWHRLRWYFRGKRLPQDIPPPGNSGTLARGTVGTRKKMKKLEFPRTSQPLVSIIVPVFNHWQHTYTCLESVLKHTADIPYEVIIADDASSEDMELWDKYVKNIKLLRNKKNLGFLRNCNRAVKKVRGKYLVLLNNDTSVQAGWLAALVSLAEQDEKVGLVGSKLIYPDGRLQEAGGIIWRDGSGWNYGRGDDAAKPEYNYVKETDYCSAACVLIRKTAWQKAGGFDEQFAPAYYEDTDLAFRLRKLGYKVLYQPQAVVVHEEGISHSTDIQRGTKKYQAVNQKKFVQKWRTILRDHFASGKNVFQARDRSRQKKTILVIDHYVPHYDRDAGSRSTLHYLRLFLNMGLRVIFIGDNFFPHQPYTTHLEQLGIEVLYGPYYHKHWQQWIRENGQYLDYVLLNRPHIAEKYMHVLRKWSKTKILYYGHDLHSLRAERQYEVTQDRNILPDIPKIKQQEMQVFKEVDVIYYPSTVETALVQKMVPHKPARTIPVYFFDRTYKPLKNFKDRQDLLFVGGFAHPANGDGITWFVQKILPLIHRRIPNLKLWVVGSHPPASIRKLHSRLVRVTGAVSQEELIGYYGQARVVVIPLRYGAGVKGKLLETLYYGVPVVTTDIGAEGVPAIAGRVQLVNGEERFAEEVIRLYQDAQLWQKYAKGGIQYIERYFSEKKARNIIAKDVKK